MFQIDDQQHRALGKYVYALIDPRDQKVIYVGQGQRQRVQAHFDEVEAAIAGKLPWTAKRRRIQEIIEDGQEVLVHILRRNLETDLVADHVEAAAITALGLSSNGPTLNLTAGNRLQAHGSLSVEELRALAAPPVSPSIPITSVFVFPVSNSVRAAPSIYDAVRGTWRVSAANREASGAIAVGLSEGISRAAFVIDSWTQVNNKWEFSSQSPGPAELVGKNWTTVTGEALGYWQRGNYLIVELDGAGNFRIRHGASDKTTWRALI